MIKNFRVLTLVGLVVSCLALSACETIKGMGRDLQNAGESIEGAMESE